MAVAVGDGALRRRSYMGEDERGSRFCREPLQIDAVPGWNGRSKDARLGTEGRVGVVSDSKPIAIVRSSRVLMGFSQVMTRLLDVVKMFSYHAETTIVRLREDRVLRLQDEF